MTRRARRTELMPVVDSSDESNEALARELALPWLTDYLCRPHPEVGRDGPVCPFVEPALLAGTLYIRVNRLGPEADAEAVAELVDDMTHAIHDLEWTHSNRILHTLVVVLPFLPEERWVLLDQVQATAKPDLADRGLMLGQFHPRCAERAARNHAFEVAKSPVPMLALRHMAFHDIMFLHNDPSCFAAYDRRFGDRYRRSHRLDPLFVELYTQARRRMVEATEAAP